MAAMVVCAPCMQAQPPVPIHAPRTGTATLVWAVDGLSYEAFTVARQRGLFARFGHAGRHVAPFPSMSHPSWTEITGARTLFGARGNIRSVEASWFDLDAMRVESDPRQVLARQAAPFNYMRAFDWFFDPITEPLMYFEGDRLADRELAEAEQELLEQFTGGHRVVFLGAADAIAHTHLGRLHPYLRRLDATMNRVLDSLERRGITVESWIVSDHGNAGAFVEGQPERRLVPVALDAAFRRANLVRRDSGQLSAPNQASVVTLALASMVNVYFADLGKRRAFATAALRQPGVDLVTWLEVEGADQRIVISSSTQGEAHLRWRSDGSAAYRPIRGNPLQLPDSLHSRAGDRWVSDAVWRTVSEPGPYPDAVNRLVRGALKDVENAPDLVISLRDGYCWAGSLGRYVKMVRTHGALSARSTLGLVAATTRSVPAYVRSAEILPLIGLSPTQLFARVLHRAPHDARALADSLAMAPPRIPTGRTESHADAHFLRRVRPLTLSAEYFDAGALRALADAVRVDSAAQRIQQRRLTRTRSAIQRSDVIAAATRHIDTLVALGDSLPSFSAQSTLTLSPWLDLAAKRAREIPSIAPLAQLRDIWRSDESRKTAPLPGVPARGAVMAAWTFPFYADAALYAPETDSIDDSRDRVFARRWHGGLRDSIQREPARLMSDTVLVARLFREILAERELTRRVEGATVPLLYDHPPSDVALVYVPGIFGELFDDEIWRRGLRAVREQLGMRIIPAATDGRCSAGDNATQLLRTLHDDTQRRIERGYGRPRYLIVGYSKGGVDAAEALARDTQLTNDQVLALVTLAAPHGGTPVAERADLPDALLQSLVSRPRPGRCDTTRAVEALWPANRAAFWGTHGVQLAERIPLVSLSFTTDMQHAHPWMKITKRIAQFSEDNDGVVTVSASRFPSTLSSVHLGTIDGDHIAARNASAFPQESVLEAVVLAVTHMGLLEQGARQRWREAAAAWRRTAVATSTGGDNNGINNNINNSTSTTDTHGDPPAPRRRETVLPQRDSAWHPDRTFRMNNLEALADRPIPEATADNLPDGIAIHCDQRSITAFRAEYEFRYDAGNGGSDDTPGSGFALVDAPGSTSGRACRLHTTRTAMKMTTIAFRFRPSEFPDLSLRTKVLRSVRGATGSRGGRGRNDATIKLWYVLRDERPEAKGRRLLFGYMWSATDAEGNIPAADSLTEGSASRRRIAFSVLPEAWLMHVGGPSQEGEWITVKRNFASDLQRAFPGIPLGMLRVVALTIQTDSDDSRSASDLLLDHLLMRPRAR